MPTFLGFPIGGFAAEIVGPIDAVAAAIVGGAITGTILGFAQWLGMRRVRPIAGPRGSSPPPPASRSGLAAGVRRRLSDQHRRTRRPRRDLWGRHRHRAGDRPAVAASDASSGGLAGGLAGLWALGWTITASAGIDVESQYTVFGSSGALVVTAGTSILPIVLAAEGHRRLR